MPPSPSLWAVELYLDGRRLVIGQIGVDEADVRQQVSAAHARQVPIRYQAVGGEKVTVDWGPVREWSLGRMKRLYTWGPQAAEIPPQ